MSANRFYVKSLLAVAVSAATLNVQAQEPAEEMVIVGSNLSRARAIDQKQNDDRIIEALGVDELGQFPDRNVGESLNRLPGVSMLVEKGEGRFVQIRGINPALNNVTVNGMQLGSPEQEGGGRAAPMDVISGGILGSVQVVKTPTADMDGQGIGGTVNVDTLMPFDRPDALYGYITARAGYEGEQPEDEAYGGKDPLALDALISGKTADGSMGWLLGATWSDREYVARGVYQDDWDESNGTGLPVNVKNNYYVIGRERTNLTGAIEFRPTDMTTVYARTFYSSWKEFQHRNRYEENFSADVMPTSANTGTSGEDRVLANLRLEHANKDLFSLTFGGEHVFGDFTAQAEFQRNQNELSEPNDNWEFRSAADFGPNTWVMDGEGVVTITPDAGTPDRLDPGLIDFRRVRFFDRTMEEDTSIIKGDLRWDMSEVFYLKGGLKHSSTDRDLDDNQRRFNPGSLGLTLGSYSQFHDGGFINEIEDYLAPNIWMNIDGMNSVFNQPGNAAYFETDPADDFVSSNSADYQVSEEIAAAYLMGGMSLDRLQVIAGVRVEQTDIDSSGMRLNGGVATEVTAESDYTNVLPSLIANFHLSDQLILRTGITRGLGRPDFETIAPRSTINDDGGPIATISEGNPALEPRISWNYDLSLEWYPGELTMLSASVFYKDIDDELVGSTTSLDTQAEMDAALAARGLTGVVDTSTLTRLDISTTVNAASATLKGLELMGQTRLGFLPGVLQNLGVSASATFLDGETEMPGGNIPLVGQPEQTYAVSMFYQDERFDASLSYSYNDSFLTDYNNNPDLSLDQGEFGRWDAKVYYNLSENARVFLEAVNINNEPTSEFQGGRDNWNTEYEWVGRTYYLGLSYGF